MAMVPGNNETVSGRKIVSWSIVGCLVFTVGMTAITWGLAQLIRPLLQRNEPPPVTAPAPKSDAAPVAK